MKIQEICSSVTDGSHNPPQGVTESEYLMLSSKNIFDDNITFVDPRYLCKEDFDMEDRRTCIQAGDVLLTIVGTVGRCAVVPERAPKFTLQRSVAVLHPRVDICNSRFLMYALQGKRSYIEGRAKGVAQKGIYLGEVANIEVPIPEKSIQATIITHLDKIASIIHKRQQQLSALDDLIKARFVEMFGSQEDNPLRFNVGTLKDVADIYLGLTHTPTYVSEGKPFLSVRDISSGKIDFTNCHYISEQEFASLPNGARPKPNDILFCRVGTIGKPVIIPEGTPEFGSFVSVGFLRKKSNVLNDYLKSWMEDPYFMKQVYDNVAGASQINLNTGWLKDFSILIPPIELQKKFAAFVSQVDKSKAVIQKSLDETQLLFDSLMQEYFG